MDESATLQEVLARLRMLEEAIAQGSSTTELQRLVNRPRNQTHAAPRVYPDTTLKRKRVVIEDEDRNSKRTRTRNNNNLPIPVGECISYLDILTFSQIFWRSIGKWTGIPI
jgi:hypothetical protein